MLNIPKIKSGNGKGDGTKPGQRSDRRKAILFIPQNIKYQ